MREFKESVWFNPITALIAYMMEDPKVRASPVMSCLYT